jgi:hypothetical protein
MGKMKMKAPAKSKSKIARRPAKKAASGKIGIFWVFRGKLLAATYALAGVTEYGDAINSPTDHVSHWPQFQSQHPALRNLEYQDVPRGRVLFQKPTRKFCVYMDKALHNPKTKRAILKEFELPGSLTRFLADAHYTTDPEELNRLFSE